MPLYRVTLTRMESWTVDLEAGSADEAHDLASNGDGEPQNFCTDFPIDVDSVEEITKCPDCFGADGLHLRASCNE